MHLSNGDSTALNGASTNGVEHNPIVSLAKKVTELAELQVEDGSVSKGEIVEAIQRLQVAVEGPAHYLARLRHQPAEWVSICLAGESGVLQTLVDNGGKPVSAQELAKKTGADQLLITRFMRVLTPINVFDEVGPAQYKSNELSAWLSKPGQFDGFRLLTKTLFPIATNFFTIWQENHFTQFPDPTKGEKSPFEWSHPKDLWNTMRESPELRHMYNEYMAARRADLHIPWHEVYPAATELDVSGFSKADEPPLLVDIGGNTGYDAKIFKERNPHVKGRCVVEDLPETLASSEAPEGIQRIEYDFYTPQPIRGARVYMFKSTCHDFDDAACQKFLGNTVEAMDSGSSLLIVDFVLPDVNAPLAGATEDLFMLMIHSGMERSESQWKNLLDVIGLDVKKFWRAEGVSTEGVIEAVKR